MGRDRSSKVIAIVSLLVAVVGLSLGFAAYSTSLNITSSADVTLDPDAWNVGFSTVNTDITPGTVNGQTLVNSTPTNNGSLTLTQFVISQATNATLSTTNGSKVEYNFYIVNKGDLDAYLNSVTMGTLSCAYKTGSSTTQDDGHTTVTQEGGGSSTISSSDCNTLFTATLALNNDSNYTYNSGDAAVSSGFGNNNKLVKKNGTTYASIPVKLTIEYNNNSLNSISGTIDGDFTVSLSDSVVVYGSKSN